jgi:hypothetical protein
MAYKSAKDLYAVYFDELDVKATNTELGVTWESIVSRKRPLGSTYPRSLPTSQYDSGMTLSGWLDDSTVTMLGDKTGAARVVSILHEGNAVSDRCFNFQSAFISSLKSNTPEDEVDAFEPGITVDGAFDFGYVAAPWAARTTAGNTDLAYATMLASGASGRAYLHVTDLTLGGYTNCVITVRTSTDHSTFTDHTAFTAVTAIGAECIALPTTVNEYLSVSWAWTGDGSDQSISFYVGVATD